MSGRTAINSSEAPAPRAFYNHAIVANGFVFTSGQIGQDKSGQIVEGGVQDRAHQCIKNLKAILQAAGSSLDNVVEVNVFLADWSDFDKVNEVYIEWFGKSAPARTCVAVKTLPKDTDVEMKCIAVL